MAGIKNNAFVGVDKLKELSFVEAELNFGNIESFSKPKPSWYLYKDKAPSLYGLKMEIDGNGNPYMMGISSYNKKYKKMGYQYEIGSLDKMVGFLKDIIKDSHMYNKLLCHFDDRDSIVLTKMLMIYGNFNDEQIESTSMRIHKGINGSWSKKLMEWLVPPLVSVTLENGETIGVSKYLGGCLELFVINNNREIYICRTFNTNKFWKGTPQECAKHAKLDYWQKINEEDHNIEQNKLHAWLALDLIKRVDELYSNAFTSHPVSFYSPGSLSEGIITQILGNKTLKKVSFAHNLEEWQLKGIDVDTITNTSHMFFDANRGAIIEHEMLGNVWYGANVDIGASYPAIMRYGIPDLTGSTLEYRTDIKDWSLVPKASLKEVVFITCEFNIPKGVRHTITVKEQYDDDSIDMAFGKSRTSVLGYGRFTATAHYHEIAFLLSQIQQEQWENVIVDIIEVSIIHTTGELHPISKVIQELWDLRMELKKESLDSEYIVKLIMNAIYGKFLQAYPQYIMPNVDKLEFVYGGFKTGFLFNPVISSLITAFARIRVQEGALNIEKHGGEVIAILTDCVKFMKEDKITHGPDYMDKRFPSVLKEFEGLEENGYTDKGEKKLGWFEYPQMFEQGMFLTTAVYEYFLIDSEKWEVKTSGYQTFDNKIEGAYLRPKLERFQTDNQVNLMFGKFETTKFFHLAEMKIPFESLGITKWRDMAYIMRNNETLPKREYRGEVDLSLFNLGKNILFRTNPIDIELYFLSFDGFDDRNLNAREIVVFVSNEEEIKEKKKKRKGTRNKSIKAKRSLMDQLHAQINENIHLFPFDKFTKKEGSNGGNNARDYGIDGMKQLIFNAGLIPVI